MSTGQDRSHLKVTRFLARNVTDSGRAPCQAGSGFNGQQIWMAGWDSANLNPATPPGLPGLSVPLIAITQRVACRGNLREHDATSTAGGGIPRYRLILMLYQIASTNRRCARNGDASQRQQWAQMKGTAEFRPWSGLSRLVR